MFEMPRCDFYSRRNNGTVIIASLRKSLMKLCILGPYLTEPFWEAIDPNPWEPDP